MLASPWEMDAGVPIVPSVTAQRGANLHPARQTLLWWMGGGASSRRTNIPQISQEGGILPAVILEIFIPIE